MLCSRPAFWALLDPFTGSPFGSVYWPLPNAASFDTLAFVDATKRLVGAALDVFGRAPANEFFFLFQDGADDALEHRALEPLQSGTGLDAELGDQARAGLAIGRERVRLAPRSVKRVWPVKPTSPKSKNAVARITRANALCSTNAWALIPPCMKPTPRSAFVVRPP